MFLYLPMKLWTFSHKQSFTFCNAIFDCHLQFCKKYVTIGYFRCFL